MRVESNVRAKLWKIDRRSGYSLVQLSTSKKAKGSDDYVTDFRCRALFSNDAHNTVARYKDGDTVILKVMDISGGWDKEAQQEKFNFVVYEIEDVNAVSKQAPKSAFDAIPDVTDDDTPF